MRQCYIHRIRSINKIKKGKKLWDTQKNIEEEEKQAQKKEELEKEIKKNKKYLSLKWTV